MEFIFLDFFSAIQWHNYFFDLTTGSKCRRHKIWFRKILIRHKIRVYFSWLFRTIIEQVFLKFFCTIKVPSSKKFNHLTQKKIILSEKNYNKNLKLQLSLNIWENRSEQLMTSFWKTKLKIFFFSPLGGGRASNDHSTQNRKLNQVVFEKLLHYNLFSFYL